ncbi:MAG: NUDIX domain-containing protein [Candidatus Nanoarchaeia archaeon]|nr:NUDIX domain-containing protein [Candidatus Nanoarchaeia archaeon]
MKHKWNYDCKSFNGVYACEVLKTEGYTDCEGCKFYEPITKKILVVKLGAMGDVLRTTAILKAIKKKYGEGSQVTWLTNKESKDFFLNNPYVDRVWINDKETELKLKYEKFDVLMNFEIAPPATLFANFINAKEKYGYYFAEDGHPCAFNQNADYYLERAFSDKINRSNRKSYQRMMFEVAELDYEGENYILELDDYDEEVKNDFAEENGIRGKILGLKVGSSGRWASKSWNQEKVIEFAKLIDKETNYKILLFGGPEEVELLPELKSKLENEGIKVYISGSNNSLRKFINIVNLCDLVVTGDTLDLHIALALKKKTIGLFFCTPPWEIEDTPNLKKITSPLLEKYFYTDQQHNDLVNSISAQEVLNAVKEKNQVIVVTGIIKRDDGKFLIVKRKDKEIHGGTWVFPGGKVEDGENIFNALKREIKEEVSLEVTERKELISEYEFERPNGDITFGSCYLVNAKGEVKLGDEIKEFAWVTKEEFANYSHIKELDGEIEKVFQ